MFRSVHLCVRAAGKRNSRLHDGYAIPVPLTIILLFQYLKTQGNRPSSQNRKKFRRSGDFQDMAHRIPEDLGAGTATGTVLADMPPPRTRAALSLKQPQSMTRHGI